MSTSFVGTANEAQRIANDSLNYRAIAKNVASNMRVAMPGIIASFDAEKQTVSVDIAVYDKIATNLPNLPNYSPATGDIKIPTLLDVPIVLPRSGGFAITFPVNVGDECLVIIADMCINEWFDAGGYNNVQQVLRRHDLSDAFAILGPWSQPRKLAAYQTNAAQLRTDEGDVFLSIEASKVVIAAPEIDLDGLLALTGTPAPSVSSPSISLPVKLNGATYYLKLSATP